MAVVDGVVREVEQRFGFGNKSAAFVAETIKYLFNAGHGGLRGNLERFKQAGLEDLVASWVAKGKDNQPLTGAQLEGALGRDLVSRFGRQFSLAGINVRSALAFSIPKLVDLLTPDGVIPNAIPADVGAFLASDAARFRPIAAATRLGEARVSTRVSPWAWLLALAWAGLLTYWGLRGDGEPSPPPPPTPEVAVPPRADRPAQLALSYRDDQLDYSGRVGDEATRQSILGQLQDTFGAANIRGELAVDPRVQAASWQAELPALLQHLKRPGAELSLDGEAVRLGGPISPDERARLSEWLRQRFGDRASLDESGDQAPDTSERTNDQAPDAPRGVSDQTVAALDALPAGTDPEALIRALNLWVINFPTASAEIPAESLTMIPKAAAAIKATPEAVIIEIAGHTDDAGNATANQALSERRAQAVVEALVAAGVSREKLRARGYGSEHPIASNETAEGRLLNRRIEFKALP